MTGALRSVTSKVVLLKMWSREVRCVRWIGMGIGGVVLLRRWADFGIHLASLMLGIAAQLHAILGSQKHLTFIGS